MTLAQNSQKGNPRFFKDGRIFKNSKNLQEISLESNPVISIKYKENPSKNVIEALLSRVRFLSFLFFSLLAYWDDGGNFKGSFHKAIFLSNSKRCFEQKPISLEGKSLWKGLFSGQSA